MLGAIPWNATYCVCLQDQDIRVENILINHYELTIGSTLLLRLCFFSMDIRVVFSDQQHAENLMSVSLTDAVSTSLCMTVSVPIQLIVLIGVSDTE